MPRKKRSETVTITQLHRNMHAIMQKVRAGVKVIVTEYGKPEYVIRAAGSAD